MKQPISIIGLLFGICVTFWTKELTDFIAPATPRSPSGAYNAILLAGGLVFLADILCVLWWYANYVYKVEPESTLYSHFLDFTIVGMFALAAGRWQSPVIFLIATSFGAALLGWRFYRLGKSPQATSTDRQVLRLAGSCLAVVAGVSVLLIVLMLGRVSSDELLACAVFVFSLVGVVMTLYLREKIEVASALHDVPQSGFRSMALHWPDGLADDSQYDRLAVIREATTAGLQRCDDLFKDRRTKRPLHDKLRSRVHADADLVIQSYILSLSSPEKSEITAKAFMVGVAHWLDDLVDGRAVIQLKPRLPEIETFLRSDSLDQMLDVQKNEELFDKLYERLVTAYADKSLYERLKEEIKGAVPQTKAASHKLGWPFFGLNRVALGAILFSPFVYDTDRKRLLDLHNIALCELARRSAVEAQWEDPELEKTLNDMRESPVGSVLLGLTTKTTQEIALSSEDSAQPFFVSLLHSLVYAPLLYYHDIGQEIQCGEMLQLPQLDVNVELALIWLPKLRNLDKVIDRWDPRANFRAQQLEMAYRCFEHTVPTTISELLRPVYLEPFSGLGDGENRGRPERLPGRSSAKK